MEDPSRTRSYADQPPPSLRRIRLTVGTFYDTANGVCGSCLTLDDGSVIELLPEDARRFGIEVIRSASVAEAAQLLHDQQEGELAEVLLRDAGRAEDDDEEA